MRAEELPHYTYDDYPSREGRWALIEGVPFAMTPAPSIAHLTEDALADCTDCQPLLPVVWKINDHTVVQPDNLVIYHTPEHDYLTRPPVLVFEVISPSSQTKDRKIKFRLCQDAGVRYFCLVDPETEKVHVYRLDQGRYGASEDGAGTFFEFDLGPCRIGVDFTALWN